MQFEPAVKDAAGKAEPAAKDFTSQTVRPAGDYVADNAVPMTQAYGEPCLVVAFKGLLQGDTSAAGSTPLQSRLSGAFDLLLEHVRWQASCGVRILLGCRKHQASQLNGHQQLCILHAQEGAHERVLPASACSPMVL